jgi:hypothetical protein
MGGFYSKTRAAMECSGNDRKRALPSTDWFLIRAGASKADWLSANIIMTRGQAQLT